MGGEAGTPVNNRTAGTQHSAPRSNADAAGVLFQMFTWPSRYHAFRKSCRTKSSVVMAASF